MIHTTTVCWLADTVFFFLLSFLGEIEKVNDKTQSSSSGFEELMFNGHTEHKWSGTLLNTVILVVKCRGFAGQVFNVPVQ